MALTKDDERWLACLDRALTFHASHGDITPSLVTNTAMQFYAAMHARRAA